MHLFESLMGFNLASWLNIYFTNIYCRLCDRNKQDRQLSLKSPVSVIGINKLVNIMSLILNDNEIQISFLLEKALETNTTIRSANCQGETQASRPLLCSFVYYS